MRVSRRVRKLIAAFLMAGVVVVFGSLVIISKLPMKTQKVDNIIYYHFGFNPKGFHLDIADPLLRAQCLLKRGLFNKSFYNCREEGCTEPSCEIGVCHTWSCDAPFSDAGKVCSSGSECEGVCLANEFDESRAEDYYPLADYPVAFGYVCENCFGICSRYSRNNDPVPILEQGYVGRRSVFSD